MKVDKEEKVRYEINIWKPQINMFNKSIAKVLDEIKSVNVDEFLKDQVVRLEYVGGQVPGHARFILWELHKLLNVGTREQDAELESMVEQCQDILVKVKPITAIVADHAYVPKYYIPELEYDWS